MVTPNPPSPPDTQPQRRAGHLSTLRDRISRFVVDSDPGRLRLRSAATTTLSLVLAIGLMLVVTRELDEPVTLVMLGAIVAMQSSAAVKDRRQRDRVITILLLPFAALGAVSLAAVLGSLGKIPSDVGFIAVLFVAVWLRRFGPRGNALGMVAFMSYFFATFIHATPDHLPVLFLAVCVGIGSSLFVRTLIFPDRPRAEVTHLVRALRAVSVSVLDAVTKDRKKFDLAGVRRRLDRLGEHALMIDDWLDRHDAAQTLSVTSDDLELRVFDAQVSLEQLAGLLWRLDPTAWTDELVDAIIALRMCLQDKPSAEELRAARSGAAAAADRADISQPAGLATVIAYRAVQAHLAIHHITTNALGARRSPAQESEGEETTTRSGLHPSTKAAIQVAVATSAAIVLGELISPARWYWAVLTAFLVFTGVSTRGEILTRAGHRLFGTIAGVVAGVLLAALVGHNPPLQFVILVICVFFAFYLVTVAYAWLTFFITLVLAMMYGLLGDFSIKVLELRIAETAVGGAVGIVSAYIVFSTGTRTTFVDKANAYCDQLTTVIDDAVASVVAPGGTTELVTETRALDNALQETVKAAKPLRSGLAVQSRDSVARVVRGMQAANRSAHVLARAGVNASRAQPDSAPSESTASALTSAAEHVTGTVASVKAVVDGKPVDPPDTRMSPTLVESLTDAGVSVGQVRAAVRALNNLDRALSEAITRV